MREALLKPLHRQFFEVVFECRGITIGRDRELGQLKVGRNSQVNLLSNLFRGFNSLGEILEEFLHVRLRLEVHLWHLIPQISLHIELPITRKRCILVDMQQNVMCCGIFLLDVVRVVGYNKLDPELFRKLRRKLEHMLVFG